MAVVGISRTLADEAIRQTDSLLGLREVFSPSIDAIAESVRDSDEIDDGLALIAALGKDVVLRLIAELDASDMCGANMEAVRPLLTGSEE